MTDGAKCPPECDLRLNGFKESIDEIKQVNSGQWDRLHEMESAVTERVRIKTLIVVVGIAVTAGLSILGWTFNNLKYGQERMATAVEQVQDEVFSVQHELTKVATQLEERTRGNSP